MNWLANNWIWVALIAGLVILRMNGHRRHHHVHQTDGRDRQDPSAVTADRPSASDATKRDTSSQPRRHHHHGVGC